MLAQGKRGDEESRQTKRDIDEEDPVPGVELDEIAADERAAGWRNGDRHGQSRGGAYPLRGREGAEEHGHADRSQQTTADSLQDAKGDDARQTPGESAKE